MSFPVLSIYRLTMGHGGKPWVSDFNDPNYLAGRAAMKRGMWSCRTSVKILQPRHILLADHEEAMMKKPSNCFSIAVFFWLIMRKQWWRSHPTSSALQCSFGWSWGSRVEEAIQLLQHCSVLLADHEEAMLKKPSNFFSIAVFFWPIMKKRCRRNNFYTITSWWSTKRMLKKQCWRNNVFSITFSWSTKRTLWLLQHHFFMISQKNIAMLKKLDSLFSIASSWSAKRMSYGHKICLEHAVTVDSRSGWTSPTFSRWPWKISCYPSLSTFNLSLKVSMLAVYQDSR